MCHVESKGMMDGGGTLDADDGIGDWHNVGIAGCDWVVAVAV